MYIRAGDETPTHRRLPFRPAFFRLAPTYLTSSRCSLQSRLRTSIVIIRGEGGCPLKLSRWLYHLDVTWCSHERSNGKPPRSSVWLAVREEAEAELMREQSRDGESKAYADALHS